MSAENAILIFTLTNPETFGYEYHVGHCGNYPNMKYADDFLDFINSGKTRVFRTGQMGEILSFAGGLDVQYGGTEYGLVTENRYSLFTIDDLVRYTNENYANNSG